MKEERRLDFAQVNSISQDEPIGEPNTALPELRTSPSSLKLGVYNHQIGAITDAIIRWSIQVHFVGIK